MKRPAIDIYFTDMLPLVAARSTCVRRAVGCILVDEYTRVLGMGYNGVARGLPHCLDSPCQGANFESGQGLDLCDAIHAEQNAVITVPDVYKIRTCYVSASPCVSCTKLLLNTSCSRIVFLEDYPNNAEYLWRKAGRAWIKI